MDFSLLIEAERRGILPADKQDALNEARRRGLVGGTSEPMGPPEAPYKGTILPFSRDEKGNIGFDSDAGLVGTIKRAIMAPGDVLTGKLDPYSPEGQERAFEAAGVMSPLPAPMRAGERAIPGVALSTRKVPAKVPTAAELKAASDAAYKKVGEMGVEYPVWSVKGMADDIAASLEKEAYFAENNPELFTLLNKYRNSPEGAIGSSLQSLDAFRKRLGDIAMSIDPSKSAAASIAIKAVDRFIDTARTTPPVAGASAPSRAAQLAGPQPPNFTMGEGPRIPTATELAEEAARTIVQARGNASARFRSNDLTGIENAAELRAAAAGSGRNLGNTIRQRLASFILDEGNIRGFSAQELAAIREVVEGTATTNTIRQVSNMLGGGGGLGLSAMAALGAMAGGDVAGQVGMAVGAALPTALGAGTRGAYNATTRRQLSLADDLVRRRSPLYEERVANAPTVVDVPEASTAFAKLLMSGYFNNDPENGRLAALLMGR